MTLSCLQIYWHCYRNNTDLGLHQHQILGARKNDYVNLSKSKSRSNDDDDDWTPSQLWMRDSVRRNTNTTNTTEILKDV